MQQTDDTGSRAARPQADTHAQRLQALARANQIRSDRAEIKAAIRCRELRVATLLDDPPECLATASLAELLLAVPGLGKTRVRQLLNGCGLHAAQRLGRLTARQRLELKRALGDCGHSPRAD